MDRLRKRIDDAGIIRLIRAYLNSGIMSDGVVQERRGHCCARYADDCNVYVRSRRAGDGGAMPGCGYGQ